MPQAPPQRPSGRQAILQAVYEDNRGGGDAPLRRPSRRPPPAPRRGPRWPVVLPVLAALAGLGAWAVVQLADARPEPVRAESASEAALPAPEPPPPLEPGAGVADLLNLQVRTIVIDPGHGGRDPGTVGPTGLAEKAVTLDVARRLRDRLDRHGAFEVLLTRDDDRAVGLDDRVAFANRAGADLYVSVHVNAFADPALAPVETFFFGVEADSAALALAREANAGTAFSVADFNAALRRAGTAVKLQESQALARAVQDALVETRPADRRRWVDEGARPAPFAVLLYTDAPAVLAEVTALSNPAEEARLRDPEARGQIAAALEAGVLAYLRSPLSTAPVDASEEDR